jgi:hypothetical protein
MPLQRGLERRQLAARRNMVRRPENQPDPLVTQRRQVPVRLVHCRRVIRRDPRKIQVLGRRVDEYDRQTQLQKARIVLVRRVGFGVLAAGKHHAGHLSLEQHLNVLRLGSAPGSCAQDSVEPALRERSADYLRQRRKDRVLQLREHEPDHARAPYP